MPSRFTRHNLAYGLQGQAYCNYPSCSALFGSIAYGNRNVALNAAVSIRWNTSVPRLRTTIITTMSVRSPPLFSCLSRILEITPSYSKRLITQCSCRTKTDLVLGRFTSRARRPAYHGRFRRAGVLVEHTLHVFTYHKVVENSS